MLLVLALAVFVLAVAVVVLFAMMGELASRVPGTSAPAPWVRPLEEARLNVTADNWPGVVQDLGTDRVELLVLSTVCHSCRTIAADLAARHEDWDTVAVILSSGSRTAGDEFIDEYRLSTFPTYVDVGGDWVSGRFGVRVSPSVLVVRNRVLVAAYAFNDIAAVRARLGTDERSWQRKEAPV